MATSWDTFLQDQSYQTVSYDPYSSQSGYSYQPDYSYSEPTYYGYEEPGYQQPGYAAPAYDYQDYDPGAGYGYESMYAPPTTEYVAPEPYFDPGYTLGEQAGGGYAVTPPEDTSLGRPISDLGSTVGGWFGREPDPVPDTRWLAPAVDPTRNPQMPAPQPNPYVAPPPPQQATEQAWQSGTSQAYTAPPMDAGVSDFMAATAQGPQIVQEAEQREGLFARLDQDQAFRQGSLRQGIPDPYSYDATGLYGGYDPSPQGQGFFDDLGQPMSDLGAAASQLPGADRARQAGQGGGNALGWVGDRLYGGFDRLRDNAMRGASPSEIQQAGVGDVFNFVEPDTPFLGGVEQAVGGTFQNLGQAQNLQEVIGAPLGAIDVPDQWWRRQQSDWAGRIAMGDTNLYTQIAEFLPTEDIPVIGQAFESPMEWAANATPEQQAVIAQVYQQHGADGLWEFYQSHRNPLQRGVADVVSPWMALPAARTATSGLAGLSRIAKSSTNPAIRTAGRIAEPIFNTTGAALGSIEAAEDLGLTSLGGMVGRRLGQSRLGTPFRLTPEAQSQLDVDTRLDAAGSTLAAHRAAGSPPPIGDTTPVPPGGNGFISPDFNNWQNTTTRRFGDYRIIQNGDTGEAIVTHRGNSEVLTPRPLTFEEAEAVVDEIRAGATIEDAVSYGESLRVARTAPPEITGFQVDGETVRFDGQPADQPLGWPQVIGNEPDPATMRMDRVSDEIVVVQDTTGRFWLYDADTMEDIFKQPLQTADEARGQYYVAQDIVRQNRLDRASQGATATEITGRTTAEQPLPPEQVQRILGPNGEPISTVPVDAGRQAPGPEADPNRVTRLVDPSGQPIPPSGVGRQAPGEEAFVRASEGDLTGPPTVPAQPISAVARPMPERARQAGVTPENWAAMPAHYQDLFLDAPQRGTMPEEPAGSSLVNDAPPAPPPSAGQRSLDELAAMPPEAYTTPAADARRRPMYQGGFLRKSAPVAVEDAAIRTVGDQWQVYNTRTNARLTGKDYPTEQAARQAQDKRAELAEGQQGAYDRFVDLHVNRMRQHDPDLVVQNLRAEKVPASTITDVQNRARDQGITVSDSPLPIAPNGHAIDLTTGQRVIDPTANPANRLGAVQATPREAMQAGYQQGQSLRERAARPAQVRRTLGQAPTAEETAKYRSLPIPDTDLALLREKMPTTQGIASDRDYGDVLFDAVDEVAEAVGLAQMRDRLSGPRAARLTALSERYGLTPDDLSLLDEAAQDRMILSQIESVLKREFAVTKDIGPIAQALGNFWTGNKQFLRSLALYNWVRVPAYINTNLFGNAATALLKPSHYFGRGSMFDVKNADTVVRRVVQETRGEIPTNVSAYEKIATGLGHKPRTTVIGAPHKDQLDFLWAARSKNKLARAASKVLMSEGGYMMAQGTDQVWREVPPVDVARRDLPTMVREIRAAAKDAASRMGVQVSEQQIDAAIDTLVRAGKAESPGMPLFSAQQLKDELAKLPVRGGEPPLEWADRIHRDWRQATGKLMDDMDVATNKWAFSFRKTNLDEWAGNFVKFHVWASRASKLYVTEALRNPWLIAAYVNATEGLQKMQEENQWPESLQGFVQLFEGVGGFWGLIEPQFFMPALIAQTEHVYREEGEWGLTQAGEIINLINQKLPILDIWRAFTYYSGLEGGGNLAPDPFYGIRDSLGAVLNVINESGWLGKLGLEHADEAGLLPAPVLTISNVAAHWLSGLIVDAGADRVGFKQVPLDSEEFLRGEYQLRQIVADLVAQQNPGMLPEDQARLIDEAMADTAGDLYQEAYGQWVNLDLAKAGARLVSPLQTRIRNESQDDRRIAISQGGEDAQAAYDIDAAVRRAGPEDAAFETTLEEYYAAGDDLGHQIAESYFLMLDGQAQTTFRVNGREYTPQDLAAMSESERYELAQEWMDAIGAGYDIDARQRMDARYDAQNELLAANPDVAAAIEFRTRAEEYGPGVDAFIEETAGINGPYRQYLDSIPEPVGSPEWRRKALSTYAAGQAVQGMARDIFNPIQDEDGAGRVAGLPEETTLEEAWHIRQAERDADEEARRTEREEQEADYELGSEYIQDARRDLPTFGSIQQRIMDYDPTGAQWDIYLDRVSGNDDARIDGPLWDALLAEFETVLPSGGAEEYIIWANSQPQGADLSFDAWREADNAAYDARQERIAAENPDFDPATLVGGTSEPLVIPGEEDIAPAPPQLQTWGELSGQTSTAPSTGGLPTGGASSPSPTSFDPVPIPTEAFHDRGGAQPVGIVYHVTGDLNLDNVFNHFLDPANEASSHYVIDVDGTVYEMVPPEYAAWTHGDVDKPRTDIPWVNDALASGQNLNNVSFGIEFMNDNGGAITEEQYAAGVAITQWLAATYGIQIDPMHVIGHRDINSVDRDLDPGPAFPMDQMIQDAAR